MTPAFPWNARRISGRQLGWTQRWHQGFTTPHSRMPWSAIELNHRMNFELWHEEDIARRDDLGAERVRRAKRTIDRCNQMRNDAIEAVDVWLLKRLSPPRPGSPQHSETPGMIVDRLSILSLKIYHMRVEARRRDADEGHRAKCRARCDILEEQIRDLKDCLQTLLDELRAGTRRFKVYRQFKMYNDASLNPQLYSSRRSAGRSVPGDRKAAMKGAKTSPFLRTRRIAN